MLRSKSILLFFAIASISVITAMLLAACDDATAVPPTVASTPIPTAGNRATAVVQAQTLNKLKVCTLLTSFEVGILLGDGSQQTAKSDSSCTYSSTDGKAVLQLSLESGTATDFANQKQQVGALSPAPVGGVANTPAPIGAATNPQAVPGVGTDAFWSGTALYVLQGKQFFSLTATGSGLKNQQPLLDVLKGLGRKAASRLQFSIISPPTVAVPDAATTPA